MATRTLGMARGTKGSGGVRYTQRGRRSSDDEEASAVTWAVWPQRAHPGP